MCNIFDYIGKRILTIEDFNRKNHNKAIIVKELSSDNSQWVTNSRPLDFTDLFEEDDMKMVPKLGAITTLKWKELDISKVFEPNDLPSESIEDLNALYICLLNHFLNSADSSFP